MRDDVIAGIGSAFQNTCTPAATQSQTATTASSTIQSASSLPFPMENSYSGSLSISGSAISILLINPGKLPMNSTRVSAAMGMMKVGLIFPLIAGIRR